MSIQKVNKDFTPTTKEVRYLNKTFAEFRSNLIDFAKVYFPDSYNDFNEASPGMMFIEMASYVGDVLSYYIDSQFRESLINFAEERSNIVEIAQALGYKSKPTAAASTDADMFQLVPAMGSGSSFQPDARYYLKLDANAVVSSDQFGSTNFRTTDIVNFGDGLNTTTTVYSVDANNAPLTYLVKKSVPVVAGDIKTTTFTFGSPQKFSVITLAETNVIEVLSIVDSNGFTWNEVDYLAQDVIFQDRENLTALIPPGESVSPRYVLTLIKQPRRFVTRYNSNDQLEVHFGSGVTSDSSEIISLDVAKVASSEFQTRLGSTSLDPSDFLTTTSYGLAPSNVTLTVTYVVGGGLASNVPSNTVNRVRSVNILNDRNAFSPTERPLFDSTVSSLAINNADAATGGKDAEEVEEIRQNALAFFNAQNRVVTREDYIVRCYAMPPRYGAVAKVFVVQDEQIANIIRETQTGLPLANQTLVGDAVSPNAVNLYVLGFDQNKNLVNLNDQTKANLKTYLGQYRVLTDQINLLDAFVINIGVNFRVSVFKNYNINDVIARCLDAVKSFFDIDRWQINQPIILNDLSLQIASVGGVQSIVDLEVVNKYGFRDGSNYTNFVYDIDAATENGIIYPSIDPSIFQIKFPDTDIVGSAVQ